MKKLLEQTKDNLSNPIHPFKGDYGASSKYRMPQVTEVSSVPEALKDWLSIIGSAKDKNPANWKQGLVGNPMYLKDYLEGPLQIYLKSLNSEWSHYELRDRVKQAKNYVLFYHYDDGMEFAMYDPRNFRVYSLWIHNVGNYPLEIEKEKYLVKDFLLNVASELNESVEMKEEKLSRLKKIRNLLRSKR